MTETKLQFSILILGTSVVPIKIGEAADTITFGARMSSLFKMVHTQIKLGFHLPLTQHYAKIKKAFVLFNPIDLAKKFSTDFSRDNFPESAEL